MADAETEGPGDIGDPEEIELRELEAAEAGEDYDDTEGTEETNLDDDTEGAEGAEGAEGTEGPEGTGNLEWDDGGVGFNPDIPRAPRGLGRILTQDRKIFLKNALAVSLNKGDGPNSRIIFNNLQLTNDQRSGKNNGAKYKGVKIIVMTDGRYEYLSNSSGKTTQAIDEFKATLEKAKAEHEKTAIGDTEKQLRDFDSLVLRTSRRGTPSQFSAASKNS